MKTFKNFVSEQTVDSRLIEAATLMANKTEDPELFIKKWFEENHPEVAINLDEAGFWDGVKDGATQAWQGMKAGAEAFRRSTFGPEVKFDAAIKSLNNLSQQISSDPQLQALAQTPQGNQLPGYLNQMIKKLNELKPLIPKNQMQTANNQWDSQRINPQQNPQQRQQQQQQAQNQQASQRMIQGMSAPAQQSQQSSAAY